MVKCLSAMRGTWVRSLDWEDPLEKEMVTHSSTPSWGIHGQRSLVGYGPWDSRVRHIWATSLTWAPAEGSVTSLDSYALFRKGLEAFSNVLPNSHRFSLWEKLRLIFISLSKMFTYVKKILKTNMPTGNQQKIYFKRENYWLNQKTKKFNLTLYYREPN